MVKKFIILIIVMIFIVLNFSFATSCKNEPMDNSESEQPKPDNDTPDSEPEPDYEKSRYYKKTFRRNYNFVAGSSDVEVYKKPKEPEDEQIEVSVTVKKSDYPIFVVAAREIEISAQANNYGIHYYKNNHMWSNSREVELETRHSDISLGFELGKDVRITTVDVMPIRQHCEQPGEATELDEENEEDVEENYDEDEHEDEPAYNKSHHLQRGYFEVATSVEVYKEPQENNNTDGLEIKAWIDWNEPLYYMGSTKYASVTYNGNGISVYKHGPDAGMNHGSSIEICGRHVNAELQNDFDTGVYPNVYV